MIKPARRLHNTIIRNLQHHNQLFRMSQKNLDNSYKSVYDVTEIIKQSEEIMKNNLEKYTFFYGGVFSQWYKSPMYSSKEELTFNCAEQYMMFKKASLFNDFDSANKIMRTRYPIEQKKFGRDVKGFDEQLWNEVKMDVVFNGNLLKFSDNKDLEDLLLSTKGTTLVEASPIDKIWGIGLDESTARITPVSKWMGENLLGIVLTDVRDFIIECRELHKPQIPKKWNSKNGYVYNRI